MDRVFPFGRISDEVLADMREEMRQLKQRDVSYYFFELVEWVIVEQLYDWEMY